MNLRGHGGGLDGLDGRTVERAEPTSQSRAYGLVFIETECTFRNFKPDCACKNETDISVKNDIVAETEPRIKWKIINFFAKIASRKRDMSNRAKNC